MRKCGNVKMVDTGKDMGGKIDLFREFLLTQNLSWKMSADNYHGLKKVVEKEFHFDNCKIKVQFNPERIRSSAAKVDQTSIAARKCFLCQENRPEEQISYDLGNNFLLLVNPFPIFKTHFTIPCTVHVDQRLLLNLEAMLAIAKTIQGYTLFYNGPESGASAPDHLHFQAGENGFMPVESEFEGLRSTENSCILNSAHLKIWSFNNYLRKMISIVTNDLSLGVRSLESVYNIFSQMQPKKTEPMINLLCYFNDGNWTIHFFPRKLHRPKQYFAEGADQLLISPASVDFGGVFITPRPEDFEKITASDISDIFSQVSLDKESFRELTQAIKNSF